MKTITKWWIVGTVQTLFSASLILAAPSVINSGKPMVGFAMFGLSGVTTGATIYKAGQNLFSSIKARTILLESFPEQKDWHSIPVVAFLDISPEQVFEARSSLEEILQNSSEAELISGMNVIYYISTFS